MTQEFTISRLLYLRRITRSVSDYLLAQLKEQLNTVSPLLRPRRLLGDLIEGGSYEPVVDAEKNFSVLGESYARAAGKPFELPRPLRPPLKAIGLTLEVYPWEYPLTADVAGVRKTVTITCPTKWVVSFASGLSLSRLRLGVAGKEEKKQDDVKDFVVRSCLMKAMLDKYSGIHSLFRALRWDVQTETAPDLGSLPLTTLTAPVRTTLPPEAMIFESTEVSGMSMFEEVVDTEAAMKIHDPLAQKVEEIIRAADPVS